MSGVVPAGDVEDHGTDEGPLLTIGQVAELAGLNTPHIRFYERVGVLPEPERVAGQRRYRKEVLQRCRSSTSRSAPDSRPAA